MSCRLQERRELGGGAHYGSILSWQEALLCKAELWGKGAQLCPGAPTSSMHPEICRQRSSFCEGLGLVVSEKRRRW